MRTVAIFCILAMVLAGCNSVYMTPNSLNPDAVIYANRGGFGMHRAIKQRMDERGYNVVVGHADSERNINAEDIDMDMSIVPDNVRYILKVRERVESFRPIWCVFNGFWWWDFNVSIADQKSGDEILSWRGLGCENSTLRKLDRILDEIEIKNEEYGKD